MRQEYHYTIARTDRICLVVFVTVLMMWELVKYVLPPTTFHYLATPEEVVEEEDLTPEISEYYYPRYERRKKKDYPKKYNYSAYTNNKYDEPKEENIKLEGPIQIMNANVDQLVAMGFSKKVAYNITKFISSGATIRQEKDLRKIYGMDSVQLASALPFIIFPSEESTIETAKSEKPKSLFPMTIIDLNKATPEELEALPGIGYTLAERIVKFRESLGGFMKKEQLLDCYGISPEVYSKLNDRLTVTGSPSIIHINKVDINTISHPYLPKKYLRVIQAYKNHHGLFKTESDLRQVFPHDSMWCEKLIPYVSFEIE